jgi:hypothetical protein
MPSAAQLDITPQGLRYARKFWPSFTKRWKSLHLRLGRSFLQGPEALGDWRLDQTSPFERTRILNPAPDRSAIAATLAKVRRHLPGAGGYPGGAVLGRLDRHDAGCGAGDRPDRDPARPVSRRRLQRSRLRHRPGSRAACRRSGRRARSDQ